MSDNLLEHPSGVMVTEYAGPALVGGGDRRRYQISDRGSSYVTLSREQLEALAEWFIREHGDQVCVDPSLHDIL